MEGKGTATHSAGMTHFSPEAHHEYQTPLEPSGILLSNLVETPCNPEYTNHHEEQSLEEGSVRGGSKKIEVYHQLSLTACTDSFFSLSKERGAGRCTASSPRTHNNDATRSGTQSSRSRGYVGNRKVAFTQLRYSKHFSFVYS